MDSQLDAVRHRICKAENEIVEIKQDLAAAKKAKNREREGKLLQPAAQYQQATEHSAKGDHSLAKSSTKYVLPLAYTF